MSTTASDHEWKRVLVQGRADLRCEEWDEKNPKRDGEPDMASSEPLDVGAIG